jgi:hypothetical protein
VAYRVQFSRQINRQLATWNLPDTLLVEVHLRLRQDLGKDPARSLTRLQRPFDGMCYLLDMVDPENRLREHFFIFHVMYRPDEERITVVRGTGATLCHN